MLLKPAPGRAVRVPGSMRLLSKAGEEITLNSYWHRLLRAGDVIEVKKAPAATGSPLDKGRTVSGEDRS